VNGRAFGGLPVANNMKKELQMAGGTENLVVAARTKWLDASAMASSLASEVFDGERHYGDREARLEDEGRVQSARSEADRLFREYTIWSAASWNPRWWHSSGLGVDPILT